MKLTLKNSLRGLLLVPVVALTLGLFTPVAVDTFAETQKVPAGGLTKGAESAKGDGQQSDLFGQQGIFKTITNVLLYIIGAISVIMLVIGGIRYTVSNGDSNNVSAAKNTILYAIVGIIVALLAYAVVNFVLVNLGK